MLYNNKAQEAPAESPERSEKSYNHAIARTTVVLIVVARCEFTPSIPIFTNIDVRDANTAEAIANKIYIIFFIS